MRHVTKEEKEAYLMGWVADVLLHKIRMGAGKGGVYIIITVDVDGLGSRRIITNAVTGWRHVITVDACGWAKQQTYYNRRPG